MNETSELNKRFQPRRRRRMWKRTVSALALMVVFCTVYALVLPAITLSDEPICAQQVHEHTDQCYRKELKIFACAAAAHIHEGCADEWGNMSCGFGQTVLHSHCTDCYDIDGTLLCTLPEHSEQTATPDEATPAEHLHTPSCYNEAGEQTCGLTSAVVHVHDQTCWKVVSLDEPELICKLPEHIHVDACFLSPEDLPPETKEYLCDLGAHTHGEACYGENGVLICTIPEHEHTVACKVPDYDETANVETAADWEATLENVPLIGRWPADLLSVAQSQLGYRESRQNVILSESGEVKGYTRYGAWYGAPYMDWSAAFVSFCAHYAGADGLPQDGSCQSYLEKLEKNRLLKTPDTYLPKPGDLVVLNADRSEDGSADAIGIVAELLVGDSGEITTLKFIQGDGNKEVCYRTCDLLDGAILGYGVVSDQPKGMLLCEQDHDHSDSCYGCRLYYTDDTLSSQVLLRGIRELPEGLTLAVSPITPSNRPADYGSLAAAVSKQMENSPYYVGQLCLYDMELTLDGLDWTMPEGVTTDVQVSFHQPVFTPEAVEKAAKVETFLLTPAPMVRMARSASVTGEEYRAEAVSGEQYDGTEAGLEGVTFLSDHVSTFAVVLKTEIKEGVFWERLFSVDQITDDGTYMIVSAEGNYALRGNTSSTYTQVQIEAQKGDARCSDPNTGKPNSTYYIITKADGTALNDNTLKWSFTKNGSGFVVKNQAAALHLIAGQVQTGTNWWGRPTYSNQLMHANSVVLTVSYQTPENGFRFKNGNNYLRNPGTGAFGYSSSNDGQYNSNAVYYYSRDMLIFKLSDITELVIPKDFKEEAEAGEDGVQIPVKPEYDDFIIPSGEKTGSTSHEGVNGHYYSDPATSNLEIHYREDNDLEKQKINDGKVMSDKSVIYGDDDYNAFASYDPNTFSVTLSTLGQEYMLPQQDMVTTPIDVVYILDVSGSMSSNSTTQGENPQRVFDLCNAVNASMKQILEGNIPEGATPEEIAAEKEKHKNNRVGIAIYSGGAWEMLPLDRYTAENDKYLMVEETTFNHQPTNYSFTINYLLGSNSLKNDDGVSFARVGKDAVQGIGTYTQAGIAMGHKIFQDIGDDTKFTATLGYGSEQKTVTVARQPVFILLSDGEPTYSTSIYNDVLNGPHYGNGNSGAENGKGVHGYYTVLSANYYKRMVGIQYQRQPMFYSIGIGINTPEAGDGPMVSNSNTGDNYKRAVLNPTKEVIENLTANKAKAITTDQLKGMLLNTWKDETVKVLHSWPETWTGIPHVYEPILQPNPYTDDYSYADDSFFGYLAEADLTKVFEKIYTLSMQAKPYGFILHENSSIDILDRIGQGMEVKGAPILRFNGTNYAHTSMKVENLYEKCSGDIYWKLKDGTYTTVDPEEDGVDQSQYANVTCRYALTETGLYVEYDTGVYWKLKDGTYTTVDPEGDGVDPGGYESTTQMYALTVVTTYVYDHVNTDEHIPDHSIHLSNVKVTVTDKPDGTQAVEMYVPDIALPVYTPKMIEDTYYFYYEQLPMRLIYQVGLTEESQQAVAALQTTGGSLTFYTNQWGTDQRLAHSTLLPSTTNPYYFAEEGAEKAPYHAHHDMKDINTTDTVDYRIDCHRTVEQDETHVLIRVDHMHGNNGKLVFESNKMDIPVEKQWDERVNGDIMNPVEMVLYKIEPTVDNSGKVIHNATQVATLTLTADGGWKNTFEGLTAPEEGWYYAVAETPVPGYITTYQEETISITTDGEKFFDAVPVNGSGASVTVLNTPGNPLPATGGGGVYLYTMGGTGLILLSCALLLYRCFIKRRREEQALP